MQGMNAAQATALVRPGDTVFIAGCCGEPKVVLDAVEAQPSLWQDVRVVGSFIPGVNDSDFSALGRGTQVDTIFATRGLHPVLSAGRVNLLPVSYTGLWQMLSEPGRVDIAFVQVTVPRDDGTTSFGIAVDFVPALIDAGARLVGIVNPAMPDPLDGPRVPVDRFEALVHAQTPLIEYDGGAPDAAMLAIGQHIVALLEEGDTLQLGLGKIQSAVLRQLAGRRGLGFHGGMISTPMLERLEEGTFSKGILTGVALGTKPFYRALNKIDGIAFRPVSQTHDLGALSKVPNLVSVNSVLQVDLFGQASAEMLGHRQISGQGGLVDFVRGARQSHGGRSILALPSTAGKETRSRIVPALAEGVPATVSRADVDIVVTEYGVARLRGVDVEERVHRLLAIAHPAFRDDLVRAWRALGRRSQETMRTS